MGAGCPWRRSIAFEYKGGDVSCNLAPSLPAFPLAAPLLLEVAPEHPGQARDQDTRKTLVLVLILIKKYNTRPDKTEESFFLIFEG